MCGFSTIIIKNSAFAIFTRVVKFFQQKLVPEGYSSNFNSPFYTMSYVMTQRHGIDPKLRSSKSAGQELSNEV